MPKKIDTGSLRAMLAAERSDAMAAIEATKLSSDRSDAMDYYLGDMSKDMPAADGRSSAVSTDVSDTIEGILPQLMDIFHGSDEVVKMEPTGPEDEEPAQQETDYLNYVYNQLNDGFMITYTLFKDALLQKNGIVKVWWHESEHEEQEWYFDLDENQFQALVYAVEMSDGAMKIAEHTAKNGDEVAA